MSAAPGCLPWGARFGRQLNATLSLGQRARGGASPHLAPWQGTCWKAGARACHAHGVPHRATGPPAAALRPSEEPLSQLAGPEGHRRPPSGWPAAPGSVSKAFNSPSTFKSP